MIHWQCKVHASIYHEINFSKAEKTFLQFSCNLNYKSSKILKPNRNNDINEYISFTQKHIQILCEIL